MLRLVSPYSIDERNVHLLQLILPELDLFHETNQITFKIKN
ncbi:hypothetical protein ACU80K_13310 [Bacillus mycoides]